MPFKHRPPVISKQNRAAPAAHEADVGERGMHEPDAILERIKHSRAYSAIDIHAFEIARAGRGDKSRAPDDRIVVLHAAPEIRQVGGVERLAFREANLFEEFFTEWLG